MNPPPAGDSLADGRRLFVILPVCLSSSSNFHVVLSLFKFDEDGGQTIIRCGEKENMVVGSGGKRDRTVRSRECKPFFSCTERIAEGHGIER